MCGPCDSCFSISILVCVYLVTAVLVSLYLCVCTVCRGECAAVLVSLYLCVCTVCRGEGAAVANPKSGLGGRMFDILIEMD